MAGTTKTSNKSITGAVEAFSAIMKFGNSFKVGFKIDNDWYNLIGKENFLEEQIEKATKAKKVTITYEIKPWVDARGQSQNDYRVSTLEVEKEIPMDKQAPTKTAAFDNMQNGQVPGRETIIRRLALLKVSAQILMRVPMNDDDKPADYLTAVKVMAEDLELWVMA